MKHFLLAAAVILLAGCTSSPSVDGGASSSVTISSSSSSSLSALDRLRETAATVVTQDKNTVPVRILPPPTPDKAPIFDKIFDCQPEFFDPAITPFHKIKTGGWPEELYAVGDEEFPTMMIDGWDKEGENHIDLPAPYSLTFYEFGCASTSSDVLDLYRDGKRIALLGHVLNFSFSKDKKSLYLERYAKRDDGKWTYYRSVMNIETLKETILPALHCTSISGMGYWSTNDIIITESDVDQDHHNTWVCLWDSGGNLLRRLQVQSAPSADNNGYLEGFVRVSDEDPTLLMVYTDRAQRTTGYGRQCDLTLIDLLDPARMRQWSIFPKGSGEAYVDQHCIHIATDDDSERTCMECPALDLDPATVRIGSGALRFRLDRTGDDGWTSVGWGPWVETQ